jgi:hypothetical protein
MTARLGFRNLLNRKLNFPTRTREFDFVDEFLGMEIPREMCVPVRARRKPQKERFSLDQAASRRTLLRQFPRASRRADRARRIKAVRISTAMAKTPVK